MAGASAPATIWTKKGVPKLPVLMTSDFRLVVLDCVTFRKNHFLSMA
jgi:hypothetical protein